MLNSLVSSIYVNRVARVKLLGSLNIHKYIAILSIKEANVEDFCNPLLLKRTFGSMFNDTIIPIDLEEIVRDGITLLPNVKRQPGRPKGKRIQFHHEQATVARSTVMCGICKLEGHNKKTCPKRILL